MCVLAHPDDESLGTGGALAQCAAEGIETYLVTATRGERGRIGDERPGPAIAAPIREGELKAAAQELGLRDVRFLDYGDGELDQADPVEVVQCADRWPVRVADLHRELPYLAGRRRRTPGVGVGARPGDGRNAAVRRAMQLIALRETTVTITVANRKRSVPS